jgi:hypothetical protein
MRQSRWAHFARKGEQSEAEAVFAEVPAEGGRAHEDLRKCCPAGRGIGGHATLPLQVAAEARSGRVWRRVGTTNTHEASFRKQAQQLKRQLAEKVLEVDFLKGALQKVEARRQSGGGSGETASMTKSGK